MAETRPSRTDRRSETARQRRKERRQRAARQRRRQMLTRIGLLALAIVAAGGVSFGIFSYVQNQRDRQPPEGTQTFSNLIREHTPDPVTYEQTPPVGGPHARIWQNCGFYSAPVANENGVHSLEHGAVWITYQPNLPATQVDTLRELAESQDFILVSPYPELPTPVVASAWGRQLQLESADDPRLEQFVRAFRLGPQTPELGASCTGGTSATL